LNWFSFFKLVSITAKALRSSEGLIIDSEQALDFKGTIAGAVIRFIVLAKIKVIHYLSRFLLIVNLNEINAKTSRTTTKAPSTAYIHGELTNIAL